MAVVAASVEILRLAGKSADGMLLLNGNDKETMIAIYKLKNNASRARSSAAVKAVSVTGLSDSSVSPRPRSAIGNGLWARL